MTYILVKKKKNKLVSLFKKKNFLFIYILVTFYFILDPPKWVCACVWNEQLKKKKCYQWYIIFLMLPSIILLVTAIHIVKYGFYIFQLSLKGPCSLILWPFPHFMLPSHWRWIEKKLIPTCPDHICYTNSGYK